MLSLSYISVKSFSTKFLDLIWEVASTDEDLTDYTFYVYRGGAEEGPFELLTPAGLVDQYIFRDSRVDLFAKFRDYFYKLRIVNNLTQEETTYGPTHLENLPDPLALEMARRNFLVLERGNGQKCYIFKIKRWGTNCSCYDRQSGQIYNPECLTCFNTRYVGGYHRPIVTYVSLDCLGDIVFQGTIGDVEKNYANVWMANYPAIEPGDIIVDPNNRRWRVIPPVDANKKLFVAVSQKFKAQWIAPSDIEYKLPIYQTEYQKFPTTDFTYDRLTDYTDISDKAAARLNYMNKLKDGTTEDINDAHEATQDEDSEYDN